MTKEAQSINYGSIARFLHGAVALLCLTLLVLGYWMTGLPIDHSWFYTAPFFHKLLGTCLFFIIIIKLIWTLLTPAPTALTTHSRFEKRTAYGVHLIINVLLFLICISGNVMLMAVADSYSVHETVNLAVATGIPNLRSLAYLAHMVMAYSLAALVVVHLCAVTKHTLFDKDSTLRRMFGR